MGEKNGPGMKPPVPEVSPAPFAAGGPRTVAHTQADAALTRELLDTTREIIRAFPERIAGTPACRQSADTLAEKLRPHCDAVAIEPFAFHPGAFLGFMKFQAVAYLLSTLCFLLGGQWRWVAAVGYTLANINSLSQFVFYREWFDPLYRKRTGYNVAGTVEPTDGVRQQVIIAGHHDAAYVFNYLVRFQRLYSMRITLGIVPTILAMFLVWTGLLLEHLAGTVPFYDPILPYLLAPGILLVGELFFFVGRRGVPGAGDNLVSSVMLLKLAEIFGQAKKSGLPLLKHTRLILCSHDAEESGLRGARAYVKRHRKELLAIPTRLLNLDSIYDLNEIHFLTSDINGTRKLSPGLAEDCARLAGELGYQARTAPMPFGGGGTDAAEYARIGVEATTLIALSIQMVRDRLVYHTLDDQVDNLDPQAVQAAFRTARAFVLRQEERVPTGSV